MIKDLKEGSVPASVRHLLNWIDEEKIASINKSS